MFGLTIEKLAVIAVIAVFILGPDRLPLYAARFASFVRGVRDLMDTAKSRVKDELGDDFDDIEWKKLDPRQYDPRRIVREALSDSPTATGPVEAAESGQTVDARALASVSVSPSLGEEAAAPVRRRRVNSAGRSVD